MSCNSYNQKQGAGEPSEIEMSSPGLDTIQKYLFQPYCISCHSTQGGDPHDINLETYNNILLNLDEVLAEAAVKKTMPPGHPVSPKVQQLLVNWISNGAPQSGINPIPHPMPIPAPTPVPMAPFNLAPTWTSISQNFTTLCMKCHGPGGKAAKDPVNDLQYLISSKLVVPGDALRSKLFKEIRTGKMPPKNPYDPLDVQAIQMWIQRGANNN
jgi:mono/diheme cytochrome c family protein